MRQWELDINNFSFFILVLYAYYTHVLSKHMELIFNLTPSKLDPNLDSDTMSSLLRTNNETIWNQAAALLHDATDELWQHSWKQRRYQGLTLLRWTRHWCSFGPILSLAECWRKRTYSTRSRRFECSAGLDYLLIKAAVGWQRYSRYKCSLWECLGIASLYSRLARWGQLTEASGQAVRDNSVRPSRLEVAERVAFASLSASPVEERRSSRLWRHRCQSCSHFLEFLPLLRSEQHVVFSENGVVLLVLLSISAWKQKQDNVTSFAPSHLHEYILPDTSCSESSSLQLIRCHSTIFSLWERYVQMSPQTYVSGRWLKQHL